MTSILKLFSNIQCDWISMPFKDRRRGFMWRCRSCGSMCKSRFQPGCALKSILSSTKGGVNG